MVVNLKGDGSEVWETEMAWNDLRELFEVCRWRSARTAQWDLLFSTTLSEMLPPMERLSLPGEMAEADASPFEFQLQNGRPCALFQGHFRA